MRKLALLVVPFLLISAVTADAKVVNVEFNFSPFVGDTAKDEVEMVAGDARVFLNGIPIAEQAVEKHMVPVLFEAREVGPALWLTIGSLGSAVRRGKNKIRIEFDPADDKKTYRAQLRWASVTDQTTTTGDAGHGTTTNQAGEGIETKDAKGKVVLEREFTADFAADQPWHHYPPVTQLSDADKKTVTALVAERVQLFKPDFEKLYALLKQNPAVDAAAMRTAKCLDNAHAAGVKIAAAESGKIEVVTTGGPAVVVQAGKDGLYSPTDPAAFDRIKGEEAQMCASVALFVAFPPRLVVVRSPDGSWNVVP